MRDNTSFLLRLRDIGFTVPVMAHQGVPHKNQKRTILSNISMDIKRGEIITLIGPNGAGKTTLLKIMLGLLKPTEGDLHRSNTMRMGYVPQKIHMSSLLPIRVMDFMELVSKDAETLQEYLSFFKLEGYLHASLHDLSGGELQKILLIHSMLLKPDLLILDEPSQGVDITTQSVLYQFIDKVAQREGCAVVLVSHDLHIVMAKSHHVYCLNGHICCEGHPKDVRQHPSYQGLFGGDIPSILAPYHHDHDHHHQEDGTPCHESSCDHT